MPKVKVLRGRGATVVVEANAEVLFMPGGPLPSWSRDLTNAVKKAVAAEAPTNKRPRWAHYGKPLKGTIRGTSPRPNPGALRVDSAVGSTAAHAIYVDQGTQAFNAKILPPWTRGGPDLREHTWRPHPGARQIGTIPVRGQKAQRFFAKGLAAGMAAKGLKSIEVPGVAGIFARGFPEAVASFPTSNSWTPGFQAQLEQWREWRDAGWKASAKERAAQRPRPTTVAKPRKPKRTAAEIREANRVRQAEWREANRDSKKSTARAANSRTGKPQFDMAAAQAGVSKYLKSLRLPASMVKSIHIKPDGTFTYVLVKKGVTTRQEGRWN